MSKNICENCEHWQHYKWLDKKHTCREYLLWGKKTKWITKQGVCKRFPKHEDTTGNHSCYEFEQKEKEE